MIISYNINNFPPGQKYRYGVDVWSLGVLLYLMLYGFYPFDASSTSQLMMNILTNPLNYSHMHAPSPAAISFITRCLQRVVKKRFSAAQALEDPWITRSGLDPQTSAFAEVDKKRIQNARKLSMIHSTAPNVKVEEERNRKLSIMEEQWSKGQSHAFQVVGPEDHANPNARVRSLSVSKIGFPKISPGDDITDLIETRALSSDKMNEQINNAQRKSGILSGRSSSGSLGSDPRNSTGSNNGIIKRRSRLLSFIVDPIKTKISRSFNFKPGASPVIPEDTAVTAEVEGSGSAAFYPSRHSRRRESKGIPGVIPTARASHRLSYNVGKVEEDFVEETCNELSSLYQQVGASNKEGSGDEC